MNSVAPIESAAAVNCFHCGEDVPAGSDFSIEIGGRQQPMCCPGCRAVAGLIAANGLERFYDQRTAFNRKPDAEPSDDGLAIYDDPDLQQQFCDTDADGMARARLLIGGVTCAACTWLIESTLKQLPAIEDASLNLTQSRLELRFDTTALPMSAVFRTLIALGYTVRPWQSSSLQDQASAEYRSDLRRLAVAGIGMMQVGMFGIALHAGDIQGISDQYQQLLRLVSLLVTGFIVLFSARGFFESAWRHLRHGALVMDLPVALAIGLAFAASAVATLRGSGEVYFDSVVMFTFLLLLARFVEKRLRLRDALHLQNAESTLPDAVLAWRDGDWRSVPRPGLAAGDRVLLRAGDTVPIDGVVYRGESAVREDSFSGEAVPRRVGPDATVFAGTLNIGESLELRATGSYAETRLAALQRSIDSASHSKPALARLADRVAAYFIAGVLLATVSTALIWWQLDPARAFWIALSVLVISCPCALSLATPATLANAATFLRNRGVVVHGDAALETFARATHVIFDKTGTLTTGRFRVAELHVQRDHLSEEQLLSIATAMQRHSNHPIATAFAERAADPEISESRHVVAAGVECRRGQKLLRMGSLAFCREIAPTLPEPPQAPLYWIALCETGTPLAWIGLADELRPEADAVLGRLRDRGLALELLTGDASGRAAELGESLGFDRVFIGRSPQQKLDRVAELQATGAVVAMVGDGLNDAPVLRRADVSVAVAGATDLARAQADFVIDSGDLAQVAHIHAVAGRTRRVILQNMTWALGYNALGIPLAAMGWVAPWAAAIGMSLSSLLVVTNATRLRRYRPRKDL